jgi:hypothetical protein
MLQPCGEKRPFFQRIQATLQTGNALYYYSRTSLLLGLGCLVRVLVHPFIMEMVDADERIRPPEGVKQFGEGTAASKVVRVEPTDRIRGAKV